MNLRDNILATLAYYDVLDRPLSVKEIKRYLVCFKHLNKREESQPEKEDIARGIVELIHDRVIQKKDDQYFLFDRQYLIALRKKHERLAERKIAITRRVVKWLKHVPFVRAIFASGSLSLRNTNELSDLDILIVAQHGHIWTARFLNKLLLAFLGIRRVHYHSIAPDKICENHYVTDKSLEIPFQSLYTAQLYANLEPLYVDETKLLMEFQQANAWLKDYIYRWEMDGAELKGKSWIKKLLGFIFAPTFVENLARKYQHGRIKQNTTEEQRGRITYTDQQLEFHPDSAEARIIPGYNERIKKLELSDTLQEKDSGLK